MNSEEIVATTATEATGDEVVELYGEHWYRIADYDGMPPFFMTLASATDLWLFISSSGGLSAGRRNPDGALFPYYTEDRIAEDAGNTGHKAIFRARRGGDLSLWQPFSSCLPASSSARRNIYKTIRGDAVLFEEVEEELGLAYRYGWSMSDQFGIVKTSRIEELHGRPCEVELLDGLVNLLPADTEAATQLAFSNLLDAYKRGEARASIGLGIYSYGSLLSDLPEPNEALQASAVWSEGLDGAEILLSERQIKAFLRGGRIAAESEARGQRCAYLAHASIELGPREEKSWRFVADVGLDAAAAQSLAFRLESDAKTLGVELSEDLQKGGRDLDSIVGGADGFQRGADFRATGHHYANVLFNVMRGGTFADGYRLDKRDFLSYFGRRSPLSLASHRDFFDGLPEAFGRDELVEKATRLGSPSVERLCREYLPLMFGRRHGDPSRPWNRFSIDIKESDGTRRLDWQGNWRDIFQNWEALARSYPGYIESMISAFLNATTPDGYNPYRIMRTGFEWELPDPGNPWSNIGYWSDHQIVYLGRLLELSTAYHPGALGALLDRRIFASASMPYRIRPYANLVSDPYHSIEFDRAWQRRLERAVEDRGADGKLVASADGEVFHVSLLEKLLSLLMAKLGNFVPGGGLWMNTQRPEWNDANNALAGKGLSVVTTAQLWRFVRFVLALVERSGVATFSLTREAAAEFGEIAEALEGWANRDAFDDRDRRSFMDGLGDITSRARTSYYDDGFSGTFETLRTASIVAMLEGASRLFAFTVNANLRDDGLYHSYNVLSLEEGSSAIHRLDEMLEGQVAVLASGILSSPASADLLDALARSRLFAADRGTYLLYPDRDPPAFLARNNLRGEVIVGSPLLSRMAASEDRRLVRRDARGGWHFAPGLRNARALTETLDDLSREADLSALVAAEKQQLLQLYEETFGHRSFTGRSGSFFAYEGLGSVYWHMVSKLLLAAQECHSRALETGADEDTLARLARAYAAIRAGLGFRKSAKDFGAFPTDPYSHTPRDQGARQPGMTGSVKEEIIARFGELGVSVEEGRLRIAPALLHADELLAEAADFVHIGPDGEMIVMTLDAGSLAFTLCGVPVQIQDSSEAFIEATLSDGTKRYAPGSELEAGLSCELFARSGRVRSLRVGAPITGSTGKSR